MELTRAEEFFIKVYRNFDFLRQYDFEIKEFCSEGREIWVTFKNKKFNREICIILEEPFIINVYIKRKNLLAFSKSGSRFSIYDYCDKYFEKTDDVSIVAKFIKENLMPVIKGEMWINKLLKQKKIVLK